MESTDELSWINKFLDNGIDLKKIPEIDRIRNFFLLWNLFETIACGRFATINSIEGFVDGLDLKEKLQNDTFKSYFDYFSVRYFNTDGTQKEIFEDLKFRNTDADNKAKETVRQVLTGKVKEPKDALKALLFITFRFRNNLFHGGKQVVRLNEQIDNFKEANNLLKVVLDLMKKNHYNLPIVYEN